MTALIAIETVVLAMLAVLVVGLLRSHAEILRRLAQLDPEAASAADGSRDAPVDFRVHDAVPSPPAERPGFADAAAVSGSGIGDDALSVPVSGVDHATLLAFLSTECATCEPFWSAFASPSLDLPGASRLVVVTKGPEHESATAVSARAPDGIALVLSDQAWVDYDVPGSPYFVLVDGREGRVRGEGTGASWEQVRRLLGEAMGDAGLAVQPRSGAPDGDRAARVDRELLTAGIRPGDPSLYQPAGEAGQ